MGEIRLMLPFDCLQMSRQRLDARNRQHGRPVLLTLTAPNHDLPLLEIDVFDAQLEALLPPEPRAIQESQADIKQTQRYLNITDEELRKAMTGVWERRRQLRAVSQ